MKLVFFSLLVTSTLLVSAAPTPKILADILAINIDAVTLDNEVTAFNGSFKHPFSNNFRHLRDVIDSATADVKAVATFNDADSYSIAGAVSNATNPIITLLVDLMNKAPTVIAAGYKSVVLKELNNVNTDTIEFFNALESEVVESAFSELSASQEQISAALSDAISDYS